MKIEDISIELKTIPLKTPFITALRRVENVEFVRIRLRTDNALVAIGEAPATKAITGEDLETIQDSIKSIEKDLLALTPQEALEIVHASGMGSSAKACLDMALISLMSQECNQDMAQFLGSKTKGVLQTDVTISLKNKSEMLSDSIKAYQEGLDILKVKLGSDIEHAIEVTKSIATNLPDAKLLIDANQAWSLEDTLKFIEAMKDIKIELIEQPVVADDIESLKIITEHSHIAILADEAVFSMKDAHRVIESKAADMINIKLMKCGGITKAVEILEYARTQDVKCMLGSMLEGPYSINAALYLAQAYRDVIEYIDLDSPLLYKEQSDELEYFFDGSYIHYKENR